jgi:hypothetical protein
MTWTLKNKAMSQRRRKINLKVYEKRILDLGINYVIDNMSCSSEEETMPCGCPLNKCHCEQYRAGIERNKQQMRELEQKLTRNKKNKSSKLLPKYFAGK